MLSSSGKYIIALPKQEKTDYFSYLTNSAKINHKPEKLGDVKPSNAKLYSTLKQWLWSKQEYKKNYQVFDAKQRLPLETFTSKFNNDMKVWICRYCGKHQVVNIQQQFLMKTNLAFQVPANYNQKQNNQPLILFIIDWSSSMQVQILSNEQQIKNKKNQEEINKSKTEFQSKNKTLIDLFQNSDLVKQLKKIQKQLAQKARLLIKGEAPPQQAYMNICKNHLLLSMVENVIKKIKEQLSQKNCKTQRKFGFLFFNDFVFITGDCTSGKLSIVCDKEGFQDPMKFYLPEKYKHNKIDKIDFQSFETLYQYGVSKKDQYNNYLKDWNSQKASLEGIIPQGKTALGPALAIGLGIISQYGEGSNIVIITDGLANKGLLSTENSQQKLQQNITKIKNLINKNKCKLGILQWKQLNQNQNPLNSLLKIEPTLAIKYEVDLLIKNQTIKMYKQSILDLAFKQRIQNEIVNVQFKHNVDFIEFKKSDRQQYKANQKKQYVDFISQKSAMWMDIIIHDQKVDPQYFSNTPIYTQLAITMKNIDDGKRWCYVSQVQNYLTKNKYRTVNQMKQQLTNQRMDRCLLDENTFGFRRDLIQQINNSFMIFNSSFQRAQMDQNSKFLKSVQYHISHHTRNHHID